MNRGIEVRNEKGELTMTIIKDQIITNKISK